MGEPVAPDRVVVSCTDIRKRFGGLVVLDGVSFSVAPGAILGVAGPNGAGKTTLFDVISGRTKADSGRVELDGRNVTRLPAFRRARLGLGRTYQSPLVPESLTVGETLEAARAAWLGWRQRVDGRWACSLVRLEAPDERPARQLDALGRRKLLLACLLMHRPSVLLLDEPASGLLQAEITELDEIIRAVRDRLELAVVIVEHRLELLFGLAGRVLVLDEGRKIAEGPPAEVFADPVVRAAYFDAPPVAA
jgi:branched-chain amino acid transport system ATP-binding protein